MGMTYEMVAWYRVTGEKDGMRVDVTELVADGRRVQDGRPWRGVFTEYVRAGLKVERLPREPVEGCTTMDLRNPAPLVVPPSPALERVEAHLSGRSVSANEAPPWLSCAEYDIPAGPHGGRYVVRPVDGILKSPADIDAKEEGDWFVFPEPSKWMVMCAPGLRRKADGWIRNATNEKWLPAEALDSHPLDKATAEIRRLQGELAGAKATLDARTKANGELREIIEDLKKGLPMCKHTDGCSMLATAEFPWGTRCDDHSAIPADDKARGLGDLPHAAVVRRFGW
jgi:hypothetical protein